MQLEPAVRRMRHEEHYELFFETLSNKLRIQIILALERKPMTVGELHTQLGQEQSKVSHSLEALRACRVVNVKEKGRERVYSLNKGTILPILRLIDSHACENCKMCEKLGIKVSRLRKRKGSAD